MEMNLLSIQLQQKLSVVSLINKLWPVVIVQDFFFKFLQQCSKKQMWSIGQSATWCTICGQARTQCKPHENLIADWSVLYIHFFWRMLQERGKPLYTGRHLYIMYSHSCREVITPHGSACSSMLKLKPVLPVMQLLSIWPASPKANCGIPK